ncbi:MAG: SDR family oxidoreductase [Anaerolineaceae bacterium]|nr:SDR family oxidoreductase [Anaerolineaceae bacterium]
MTILITGATGQFGSIVARTLLESGLGEDLAVSVRNPDKAGELKARGVDVRQGDFDDPASLSRAFAGVERLLLISATDDNATRIRQHTTAVRAAQEAGVSFIAYTSIAGADRNPLGLAEVHRATEEAIRASGIAFAFLRNNWYLENELGYVQAALAGAPLRTATGEGKIGWALRADYAQAAAAVMAGRGPENAIYELSGPLATYDDFATALGQALGRQVDVEHIDEDAYSQDLAASGLPGFLVPVFVENARLIRQGALAVESDDFARLLGRPVTPLPEAFQQLIARVRSQA